MAIVQTYENKIKNLAEENCSLREAVQALQIELKDYLNNPDATLTHTSQTLDFAE